MALSRGLSDILAREAPLPSGRGSSQKYSLLKVIEALTCVILI